MKQFLEDEQVVSGRNDDVVNTDTKIGSSHRDVALVVVELLTNHLIEGKVRGHDDEGIVNLTGDRSLVR